jgi:uncharacterized repeat protein (TIGR03987 family)
MSPLMISAMVAITVALVLYTVGVFWERKSGTLEAKHLIFFWLGLVFDTTGTTLMTSMVQNVNAGMSIHAVSGAFAIVLMLAHAIWATVVVVRNSEKAKHGFHRFSIVVWLFWLVPYLIGMFMGMPMTSPNAIPLAALVVLVIGGTLCIQANRRKMER